MLRKLFNIFLCLLPWKLRRLILIRAYKFEIHPSAKIGFSYICPKRNVHTGNQESSPISIGDYCFVGTRCTFLPGSKLPNFSLLAAGAVISNQFNEEFGLYGGVPAKFIKKLSQEDAYFSRERGMVH